MKTDDLVSLLAADVPAQDPAAPARRAGAGLAVGLALAVGLMAATLGLHPQLALEARLPAFWVREAFCAALAVAGVLGARRLAYPGRRLGAIAAAWLLPVALMWLLAALTLADAAPADRVALLMGSTARVCPLLIAMVSVPLMGAFFWIARGLAPTRLRLAGTVTGLAAGACGALVYTLHCPELAAPFLAVWYLLGMLLPAALGCLLGPRLLRW